MPQQGILGPDPKQAILSLFAGVARQKTRNMIEARQPKQDPGLPEQQKYQLDYLQKIVTDQRSSPEEVAAANKQIQGILKLGDTSIDYTDEITKQRQTDEEKRIQEVEKVQQQIENLRKTGELTDQYIKTQKSIQYKNYSDAKTNATKADKTGASKTDNLSDNEILMNLDRSIDNARQMLRRKRDLNGREYIDYSDPANRSLLESIANLENKRITILNKQTTGGNDNSGNGKIKKQIPWK